MTLDGLKDLEKHYRLMGGERNTFAADACREIWEAHRLAIIRKTFNEDDSSEMVLSKVAKDYYRKAYDKFTAMGDARSAEAVKASKQLFMSAYNLMETKSFIKSMQVQSYEDAAKIIKTRPDYNNFDMDTVKTCFESLEF